MGGVVIGINRLVADAPFLFLAKEGNIGKGFFSALGVQIELNPRVQATNSGIEHFLREPTIFGQNLFNRQHFADWLIPVMSPHDTRLATLQRTRKCPRNNDVTHGILVPNRGNEAFNNSLRFVNIDLTSTGFKLNI